jgi:hypothetical protein
MDFSSEILIDFGLNMAGYVIVTLLVYLMLSRRRRATGHSSDHRRLAAASAMEPKAGLEAGRAGDRMEFVPLSEHVETPQVATGRRIDAARAATEKPTLPVSISRQENRRAIYREARRLLAGGQSQSDLSRRLPLTEDEIEMLSVSGRA